MPKLHYAIILIHQVFNGYIVPKAYMINSSNLFCYYVQLPLSKDSVTTPILIISSSVVQNFNLSELVSITAMTLAPFYLPS